MAGRSKEAVSVDGAKAKSRSKDSKAHKPPRDAKTEAATKPQRASKSTARREATKPRRASRFFAEGWYERFLQYISVAILVLCIAEISMRLGQGHILGDQGLGKNVPAILPIADILYYVGTTVESYFPLVAAFMLAFAAAKRPNAAVGLAVLGCWAGYLGATTAMSRYNSATTQGAITGVDLGLAGGILVGFTVAACWSSFRFRKVANWSRMLSGIPMIILVSATAGVVLGILVGVAYQLLYLLVTVALGSLMLSGIDVLGAALYGLLHPLAEVAGFSSLLNIVPYNEYGSCQTTMGDTLNGSYRCFVYGGTQLEGQQALYLAGGYPVVAFGLTALFLVLWLQLKGRNRQYWGIMYWFLVLSAFLVGAEKPALYLLVFAAPMLLLVHAVASAVSYGLTAFLGITIGWAGGPGILDMLRWLESGNGILTLLILGVIFAAIYTVIAIVALRIKGEKLNLGGFGTPYITKPFMGIPNSTAKSTAKKSGSADSTSKETTDSPQAEASNESGDKTQHVRVEPKEATMGSPNSPDASAPTTTQPTADTSHGQTASQTSNLNDKTIGTAPISEQPSAEPQPVTYPQSNNPAFRAGNGYPMPAVGYAPEANPYPNGYGNGYVPTPGYEAERYPQEGYANPYLSEYRAGGYVNNEGYPAEYPATNYTPEGYPMDYPAETTPNYGYQNYGYPAAYREGTDQMPYPGMNYPPKTTPEQPQKGQSEGNQA